MIIKKCSIPPPSLLSSFSLPSLLFAIVSVSHAARGLPLCIGCDRFSNRRASGRQSILYNNKKRRVKAIAFQSAQCRPTKLVGGHNTRANNFVRNRKGSDGLKVKRVGGYFLRESTKEKQTSRRLSLYCVSARRNICAVWERMTKAEEVEEGKKRTEYRSILRRVTGGCCLLSSVFI